MFHINMRIDIAGLIEERADILKRINNLYYGSVEVRSNNKKSFLYIHHREKENVRTRYISEYNDDLYQTLIENNELAKSLKRRMREIDKALKQEGFVFDSINEDTKINIAYAYNKIPDFIFHQLKNEKSSLSFDEIEDIVSNKVTNNINTNDFICVLNLYNAWKFVVKEETILFPSNLSLLREINAKVQNGITNAPGSLRNVPIKISGTHFIPSILIEDKIKEEFEDIDKTKKIVDRALAYYCFLLKNQIFLYGNDITALLFINHILIKHAKGYLMIPSDLNEEYQQLLLDFYNKNDYKSLQKFLYKKCYQKI